MVATLDAAAPYSLPDLTKLGYGIATVWLAPVGTALPSDTTVNMGTAWGGAWSALGATDDGWHLNYAPQTNDLNIEESPIAGAILVNALDVSVTGTLAEDTIANIKIASGVGSIAVQAPGVGAVGKSTFTLGTLLNQMALGMELANPLGHWRRYSIPNVVSVGGWTADSRRSAAKRQYATTLRAICLPSAITFTEKTAESTG